jgi:hypothetical protein
VHGSNARNLSVKLSLSPASKNAMSFLLFHIFSSTKSEKKRAEQDQPGINGGPVLGKGGGMGGEVAQIMYIRVVNAKMIK